MKRIILVLAALLAASSAFAASIYATSPAPTNIYALDQTYSATIFTNTAGKVSVSSTISGPTLVLLIAGQSICASSSPTSYTPVNANAHALNIADGIVYKATDPLLGTTGITASTFGGSWPSRLADKIITDAKFPRVILVPVCIGGTAIFDWTPSGVWNGRLRVALLRIRSMGWIGNANVTYRAVWDQGQGDTPPSTTTQQQWQDRFAQVVTTINSFGIGAPKICVPQDTWAGGPNATIRAAQAAVVDNIQIFSGGDLDTLTGANRQVDNLHLSDLGAANAAALIEPCVAP